MEYKESVSLYREYYDAASYSNPLIIKQHFAYDSDVSPYAGMGFYIKHFYTQGQGYDVIYPVFNLGLELFAKRTFRIAGDVKIFTDAGKGILFYSFAVPSLMFGFYW